MLLATSSADKPFVPESSADTSAARRTHGLVLGVNTEGLTDRTGRSLKRFRHRSGVRPHIASFYQDWYPHWSTALLNPRFIQPMLAQGARPMISWTPILDTRPQQHQPRYNLERIIAGRFDRYIRRAAREAAEFDRAFLINFAPEMNGDWFNYGARVNGNTPREFRRMWRHVVSIFRAQGADKVRWVWSPNVYSINNAAPFHRFYPGDRWVDIVGLHGYNWGHSPTTAWQSFRKIFLRDYRRLRRMTDKPVMIAETASAERGGSKARWIRNMRRTLNRAMPRVRGVIWFDRNKLTTPGDSERNWSITSSRSTHRAFRRFARSPLVCRCLRTLLRASR